MRQGKGGRHRQVGIQTDAHTDTYTHVHIHTHTHIMIHTGITVFCGQLFSAPASLYLLATEEGDSEASRHAAVRYQMSAHTVLGE